MYTAPTATIAIGSQYGEHLVEQSSGIASQAESFRALEVGVVLLKVDGALPDIFLREIHRGAYAAERGDRHYLHPETGNITKVRGVPLLPEVYSEAQMEAVIGDLVTALDTKKSQWRRGKRGYTGEDARKKYEFYAAFARAMESYYASVKFALRRAQRCSNAETRVREVNEVWGYINWSLRLLCKYKMLVHKWHPELFIEVQRGKPLPTPTKAFNKDVNKVKYLNSMRHFEPESKQKQQPRGGGGAAKTGGDGGKGKAPPSVKAVFYDRCFECGDKGHVKKPASGPSLCPLVIAPKSSWTAAMKAKSEAVKKEKTAAEKAIGAYRRRGGRP
jgi:hypothetical protein